MKFLIIGLGSMGTRRIRNLQTFQAGEIIGFDAVPEKRAEAEKKYSIKTFADVNVAFAQNPDAVIISTPPHFHTEYMLLAAKYKKPFFSEINILSAGLAEIVELCKKNNVLAAASCDMRYNESIAKIKSLIEEKLIGNVCAFTYHVGQYLPDWHPWEDYRKSFLARKDVGGCREILPGELNWLSWVFGKITNVSCIKGKRSNLDVPLDDVYQILLNFENGPLGNMLVDVVSRIPYRQLKIIGDEGVIAWNYDEETVKVYSSKSKEWKEYKEGTGLRAKGYIHKEEPYIQEMKNFVKAIMGNVQYPYLLAEELKTIQAIDAIEKSAQKGMHIHT